MASATREPSWQPGFDDLGRFLRDTTFVVVDLETTGASAQSGDAITEIGAVKVRGGEIIGEFQTLINPGSPIPPFITVLTGITDAMVIEAPKIAEVFPALLEFFGSPNETVVVAHNAPFDLGFLRTSAERLSYQWPKYPVIDTAHIARQTLTKDEVPNNKLSTLAHFFGTVSLPSHRALDDARATVEVMHGLFERLGSFGVQTLEDLQSFTHRITDAQRKKKHLAEGLPNCPGLYLFKDNRGEILYIGTTKNLRTRVRSYFTSSETRKRITEMIALADRVDVIECATVLEAEIRELRMIGEVKPRFNRRSKFQEKAHWIKLTRENFPRLSAVRGNQSLTDDDGWCGPFNGRDEAERAIDGLHDSLSLRQCSPRITERSMKSASPCALFDMGRCGAPCIGKESYDSYQTHVLTAKTFLHVDIRTFAERAESRMAELAASERFEEATEVRDRFAALIRGTSRGQRIRSLTRVPHLIAVKTIAVKEQTTSAFELICVRYGRLAGSAQCADSHLIPEVADSLRLTSEIVEDDGSILPASSHEEVEKILRYLESGSLELYEIDGEWSMPTFGSAVSRNQFTQLELLRSELSAHTFNR